MAQKPIDRLQSTKPSSLHRARNGILAAGKTKKDLDSIASELELTWDESLCLSFVECFYFH